MNYFGLYHQLKILVNYGWLKRVYLYIFVSEILVVVITNSRVAIIFSSRDKYNR